MQASKISPPLPEPHNIEEECTQHKLAIEQQSTTQSKDSTSQQDAISESPFFKQRMFILFGIIGILILTAGLSITFIYIHSYNIAISKKVHIYHPNSQITEINQLSFVEPTNSKIPYKVFSTRILSSSLHRLLTEHKQTSVDIHIVFGEHSQIILTIRSNNTIKIHLNPQVQARYLLLSNKFFRQIVEKYDNNSNSTELPEEILLFVKAIYSEYFSLRSSSHTQLEGKPYSVYLVDSQGQESKRVDKTENQSRKLLYWRDISQQAATEGTIDAAEASEQSACDPAAVAGGFFWGTVKGGIQGQAQGQIDNYLGLGGSLDEARKVALKDRKPDVKVKSHFDMDKQGESRPLCIPVSSTKVACNVQSESSSILLVSQ